jgi:hypothetical protein
LTVRLQQDQGGTQQSHGADAHLGAAADGRSRRRRVGAAGGRDHGGGLGLEGDDRDRGHLDGGRGLLGRAGRGRASGLLNGSGRSRASGHLNGRGGSRAGGHLNRAGRLLGRARGSRARRLLGRASGSRTGRSRTGRLGLAVAGAPGGGDGLGHDAANGAVVDGGRALGDGVGGVVGGGQGLALGVRGRVGGLGALGALGGADGAHGRVQRNRLGGDVVALVGALDPRGALGDGADGRGVNGRRGHLRG